MYLAVNLVGRLVSVGRRSVGFGRRAGSDATVRAVGTRSVGPAAVPHILYGTALHPLNILTHPRTTEPRII